MGVWHEIETSKALFLIVSFDLSLISSDNGDLSLDYVFFFMIDSMVELPLYIELYILKSILLLLK